MKKINNNKFRGNGNTVYSLNYKFDSVSSAGKFSGTALDLIKRYNELAKEAQSNGNYVEMEVFRQYAEHYRKIVTEINERKNQQQRDNQNENQQNSGENNNPVAMNTESKDSQATQNNETTAVAEAQSSKVEDKTAADNSAKEEVNTSAPKRIRRGFKIVEVTSSNVVSETAVPEEPSAPAPRKRRSALKTKKVQESAEVEAK